ncbi:putative BLI-3 blue-light-inducible Bli-3 protein [Poronia punctata]|nr:putative BLI-3 blue-light-inducible Bli-3 protein [Poronia punctata]
MSSGYSNTDTGRKPADPYVQTNKDTDSSAQEKFEALTKFVDSQKFGMMTTRDKVQAGKLVSRCMAVAAKEKDGMDYLFFTNTESHKTDELKSDPHVNISFLDSSGQWASVSGEADIEADRSIVKKYYSADLKAWMGDLGDGVHDGSEKDPRIGVIRVKIDSATFALTDLTILGRLAEVAKGVVTGEAAHVNKIREITAEEIKARRSLT